MSSGNIRPPSKPSVSFKDRLAAGLLILLAGLTPLATRAMQRHGFLFGDTQALNPNVACTAKLNRQELDGVRAQVEQSIEDRQNETAAFVGNTTFDRYKSLARKYGLHLIDPQPYVPRLAQSRSIDKSVEIANRFFNQYGIIVDLQLGPGDAGSHGVDLQRVDLKRFNDALTDVITSFSGAPVELVQKMKFERLTFTGGFDAQHSTMLGAQGITLGRFSYDEGRVYLNLATFEQGVGSAVTMHEAGHSWHMLTCGNNAEVDPQLTSLNSESGRYGDAVSAKTSNFSDEYGATDPLEDVATIFQRLTASDCVGRSTDWNDRPNGPVYEKALLLLKRMDDQSPGTAGYMTQAYEAMGPDCLGRLF